MKLQIPLLQIVAVCCLCILPASAAPVGNETPPNFIVILCDNLGYGDVGCYGSKKHRTPNVDRLARQGMKLTHFYATSGVCTPSRASLMTGCYPRRVSMHISDTGGLVLQPVARRGLHPDEVTIAELLRGRGYATALIGKWHLGDQPPFLPRRQGFDYYFGIPYSDDMTPRPGSPWPPLPLLRNENVIEAPVDRNTLTQRYTAEATRFICKNRNRPFFLLLAHAMPGSTRHPFASVKFRGKSANGAYGDSVEEIDWSTGRIMACLKKCGLERRTLVVWTSDNGAPKRSPPQGSNQPLSGWGYTVSEGGMRVPCIVSMPGYVPAGRVCQELATMMDWYPTIAALAGAKLRKGKKIDGKDIRPLLRGQAGAKSPYHAFFYYNGPQLQAVRSGRWKLYLPLQVRLVGRRRVKVDSPPRLYDLIADVAEKRNLAAQHPEIVRRLLQLAEQARAELGDLDRPGRGQRPAGHVAVPRPLTLRAP